MSNLTVQRTPDLIAAEINHIKVQTRNIITYNCIEIGRRLVEAKELVPYGQWGDWLKASVDYSQSTANNLMRIFQEYGADQLSLLGDNAKSQALGNLNYTQAVALLGIPADEREQFMEDHDIENMSTRELQEAIKERDKAKEALEEVRGLLKDKSNEVLKYLDEKSKVESDLRVTDQVLRKTQSDMKELQDALEKQREESRKEIDRLSGIITQTKKQMAAAENSGDSEEVERLQESLEETEKELDASNRKIQELEQRLQSGPIEAAVSIQDAGTHESIIKYRVYFQSLVKGFNDLLSALTEIRETDSEEYEKYKGAITKLMSKMSEQL
jgi:hypothetical protein